MTPQERLDYLLEVIPVENPTGWTIKKIAVEFGPQLAGKLEVSLAAMAQNLVPFTTTTLNALSQASGLSVNDQLTQLSIEQIAIYSQSLPEALRWDSQFVEFLKSLGVTYTPRWQSKGYSAEPTLQQITVELRKQELEDDAVNRLQAFRESLSAWDGSGEEPVL